MRKRILRVASISLAAVLTTSVIGYVTFDNTKKEVKAEDTKEELKEELENSISFTEIGEDKEETVYVVSDANGNVDKKVVSDWLKNKEGADTIQDKTDLEDVKNVKTDADYKKNSDGTITWNANGEDVYYQGNTDKELPVDVKITYLLDGKEMTPDEIAGKSGKVTIKFNYENKAKNTVKVNGKDTEMYVPFTMVSGLMLNSEDFTNVEVNSGKVISDGDRFVVIGMAFPGLNEDLDLASVLDEEDVVDFSDTVEITADTTNFNLGMTLTIGSANLMASINTDELNAAESVQELVGEVEDAVTQLSEGATQLKDGSATLKDGIDTYAGGVDTFVTTVNDGAKKLNDNMPALTNGTSDLLTGANTILGSLTGDDGAETGAKQLSDGAAALNEGVAKLQTSIGTAGSSDTNTVAGAVNALANGASTLDTGVATLSEGAKSLNTGATTLSNGAATLNSQMGALSTGALTLSTGAQTVANGAAQIQAGINGDGTATNPGLATGSKQVADGVAQISEELNAMVGQLQTSLTTNQSQIETYTQQVNQLTAVLNGGISPTTGEALTQEEITTYSTQLAQLNAGIQQLTGANAAIQNSS